jgi:hypothetical protein
LPLLEIERSGIEPVAAPTALTGQVGMAILRRTLGVLHRCGIGADQN